MLDRMGPRFFSDFFSRSRRLRGITVAEVTVAFFVLLLAILGMIAAMTRLAVSQGVSSHQTTAYIVADAVMKEAIGAGPPDWGLPAGSETFREAVVGQTATREKFYFGLTAVPVPEPAGTDAVFESGIDMGDLYLLEVSCWWGTDESGPEGRVQHGERRVKLGRMVYVEN